MIVALSPMINLVFSVELAKVGVVVSVNEERP